MINVLNLLMDKLFGLAIRFERTKPRLLIGGPFKTYKMDIRDGLTFSMRLDRRQSLDWAYETGKFDETTLEFIKRNIKPLTWFVDVGANQGFFSLSAKKMSLSIPKGAVTIFFAP